MSAFDALITNVKEYDTGVEFSFEDIRFNLTNSQIELNDVSHSFEKYIEAFDRLTEVVSSIESYDGKLETTVQSFVNHNGSLAAALGISLEADESTNGEEVKQSADKNIFQKAWDAICRFFKAVWGKICDFFRWIANGFRKMPQKAEQAAKTWNTMTEEERKIFLAEAKTNVTYEDVKKRNAILQEFSKVIINLGTDIKTLMKTYFTTPEKIYSRELARGLKETFGIRVHCDNKNFEDVVLAKDGAFCDMTFKIEVTDPNKDKELKPLKELGWNENAIKELFVTTDTGVQFAKDIDSHIATLEKNQRDMNEAQIKQAYEELAKDTSGWLSRFASSWLQGRGHSDHYRIEQAKVGCYQKGINNLVTIYRAILRCMKDIYVDNNKIFDLFKLTAKEFNDKHKDEDKK